MACQKTSFYSAGFTFSDDIWEDQDSVVFQWDVSDTTTTYDMILHISHSPDYAFQNLYTQIETIFPDRRKEAQELSLELSDGKGSWYGKQKGSYVQIDIPLQQQVKFPSLGHYELNLIPWMRQDSVPHLHEISLDIKKN